MQTATVDEFASLVESFDKRIHALEQQLTSAAIMGAAITGTSDFPGGITVGGIPVDATAPNAATGVTAVPGTFYDEIFCDVEWTEAATGPDAVSFDVELAFKLAGPTYDTISIENTAGTAFRFRGLQPNTAYGVRVIPVTRLGVRGTAPGWTDFTTSTDATAPIAPTAAPTVGRGATTVIVKFTPLTAVQAFDVANGRGIYEVQIDTTTGFASADLRSKYTNDQVTGFSDITTQAVWYARVRAIDSSGNVGPWSPTSTGQNAGAVDGAWAFALNATTITTGTLSATVIGTASLPIDKIYTSTLSATTITLGTGGQITIASGGSIKINNPTTNGILLNSSGMYAYGGSALTFSIDAATGNVSLKGALTTGSTITGTDIYAGTINGTTINGAVINIGSPPTEGITMNADGISAYAKPNYVFPSDRDAITGDWVSWFNATLSTSTTVQENGVSSIKAQATGSGYMGFYLIDYATTTTGMFPASSGQTWTARIRSRAGSVVRQCFVEVRFYSAAGALLQVNSGTATNNSTSEFVELAPATGTAPASTAKVGIVVQVINAGGSGESHYFTATRLTKASDASYKPFVLDSSGSIRINGGDVVAQSFRTSTATFTPGTIVDDGSGYVLANTKLNLYTTSTAAYQVPAQIYAKAAWSLGTAPYGALIMMAPYEAANSTGMDRSYIVVQAGNGGTNSEINLVADVVEFFAELQTGAHGIHGTYDGQAPALIGYEGHAHTFGWTPGWLSFFVDTSQTFDLHWTGSQIEFYYGGSYVKDFTIQHPLDEERWLRHACIEGPDAEVFYDGVAQLHKGIAWIELPAYFEALVRKEERKIQITVEDDGSDDFFAPRYSEIQNGRFRVRGPKNSYAKFSWSVTGIRKDVDRLPNEPKKSEVEIYGFGPYTYMKPKEFVSG